jgi:hypothetical protein
VRNVIATACGLLLLLSGVDPARAASFDGNWSVLQVCETTSEGARGYTWRYDAVVKDGHLLGQRRITGESSSLTLEGRIGADGTASLLARGISGSADHNLHFSPARTPISFRVVARFGATEGTGQRVGERKCAFTFRKQ